MIFNTQSYRCAVIRSVVLDAVQAICTGTFNGKPGTLGLLLVAQLKIKTKAGIVYGPFGTMNNVANKNAFTYTAPQNQSIVALNGSTHPGAHGTGRHNAGDYRIIRELCTNTGG